MTAQSVFSVLANTTADPSQGVGRVVPVHEINAGFRDNAGGHQIAGDVKNLLQEFRVDSLRMEEALQDMRDGPTTALAGGGSSSVEREMQALMPGPAVLHPKASSPALSNDAGESSQFLALDTLRTLASFSTHTVTFQVASNAVQKVDKTFKMFIQAQ